MNNPVGEKPYDPALDDDDGGLGHHLTYRLNSGGTTRPQILTGE
jgi:hypothetical protein